MNRTRRPLLLSAAVFGAALSAQEPIKEPVDVIEKRVAAGGELIEMEWQRDDAGRLLTRSKGSDNWQPLVADAIENAVGSTGVVGFLMAWLHGDNDLLGMTDGERHLRRVGISTVDAELRTLLAVPLPAGADARHPAVLDHMVAIDLLRRRGVKSAVADLGAIAKRDGLPAPLRQRAQDAAAVLQGSTRAAPAQLDPATMPLPLVADGYLIFDNSRIPDTSRLAELGRRMGLATCMAVIRTLKAPTIEDCTVGQRECDSMGELAFELARRFGNHRVTQGCVALQWQPDASSMGFCLQLAGAFDVAALALGLPAALAGFESEQADGVFAITSPEADFKFEATRLTGASAKMGGKPRPDQARRLLALGNAGIRVVLPAQSKAWLGMVALELPPATEGEVTVTFVPEFAVRVLISARDEDGADAWVQRVNKLREQYVPMVEAQLSAAGASPAFADVIAALKAIAVRAEGKSAVVEMRGKTFGWATIEALMQMARGH